MTHSSPSTESNLTQEEDAEPNAWDWIKFISWFAFASIFAFLILPHATFNLLADFCGGRAESCSPETTVEWLTSTTTGRVALAVVAAAVLWLYGPICKWLLSYVTEREESESRSFVALVVAIILLPLGLSVLVFVDLFQPIHRVDELTQAVIAEEIADRHSRYSEKLDVLAQHLEEDREILELHCDQNLVYVSTPERTFYDGEGDRYTTKYIPICRIGRGVGVERSERGVRLPHRFTDLGELFVASYLEWRRNPDDVLDECLSGSFEGEYGACEVVINENWSATFFWEPFCLDGMGDAEGC